MNTYTGLHARHYDVVYRDKPYAHEARFVDSLIREAGAARGRLLDVACGTGRHAAEFALLGWDVTGVDLSEELLEHARASTPAARFLRQDMRELDVPGEPFDAVTCLFDSIGYAVDDEGVLATLTALGRHLSDKGALVIEFLHGPALVRSAAPLRLRRFALSSAGDELVRISQTRLDETRNVMEVEFELLELRADGTYERWLESQMNRYFAPSEMGELLDSAGLRLRRFTPAYADDGEIDETTFHVLAAGNDPMRVAAVFDIPQPKAGGMHTFGASLLDALRQAAPASRHEFVYYATGVGRDRPAGLDPDPDHTSLPLSPCRHLSGPSRPRPRWAVEQFGAYVVRAFDHRSTHRRRVVRDAVRRAL